ncbi:MAG TPA: 2Fe-2S iron-sulfur cluster-binding protein [Azospirillaceae bacterium]|nr:2Fe-2S iron-sulfur cluster-binding protein [Azospirillaceae bacterium]
MPRVRFIGGDGEAQVVDIPAGLSLMEGAVRNGVAGILADCGGSCSCATCHVYVDPAWTAALPAPQPAEEDMIDFAVEPRENSRLSCQIVLTDAHDGLTVTLPARQV